MVETATYGLEFVAAQICVEHIIVLQNTICYLGVPIDSKSYIFGGIKSVVFRSMHVYAKLHTHHNMILFQIRGNSIWKDWILLYPWQHYSCRYPQQTLVIFSNMVSTQSPPALEGRHQYYT
jgi:hypothetical protein